MIENLIKEIQSLKSCTDSYSFNLAKKCSILYRDNQEESARRIIVHILDKLNGNKEFIPSSTLEIWTDIIEMVGFYPYLEKEKELFTSTNTSSLIRKEYHCSDILFGKYFHEEQKYLVDVLNENINLIVSAPTSFGKSVLIEYVVANMLYNDIVIIQPTLALLDETRKKLKKYKDTYNIIIRTSQEPSVDKRNIYLFTAERVMEYQYFNNVDFFILDEFYKLSSKRDDERSDILNNSFHMLLTKFKSKFYLLGPNIKEISKGFNEKYNAIFYKTDYSLIDKEVENLYEKYSDTFDKTEHHKKEGYNEAIKFKESILFELLLQERNRQTIIYCSSPNRVRKLALSFYNYLISKKEYDIIDELPIIEWIKKEVYEKWDLLNLLKYRIGIHDGALQKHITTSVINYFNKGYIKYLFCTSTIIEGVNTSAKNVVIFDNKKGSNLIDFFDYSNIKGRSGRMMEHYIGKVFNFNKIPIYEDTIVDIPFYEQNEDENHLKLEILNNLNEDEIKNKESQQYLKLLEIPFEERKLFKKNGVSILGQLRILKQIENTLPDKYPLLNWTQIPTPEQLRFVIDLAWDNLLKHGNVYKKDFHELNINVNNLFKDLEKNGYIEIDGAKTLKFRGLAQGDFILSSEFRGKKGKIFKILKRRAGETISPMSKNRLSTITYDYGLNHGNIFKLIDSTFRYWKKKNLYPKLNDDELYNEAIKFSFQVLKHWFQYKVPKWLGVINELQKYICKKENLKPGNYTYYASLIENDFVESHLTAKNG